MKRRAQAGVDRLKPVPPWITIIDIMLPRRRFLRVSAWLLAAAVLVPVSFAQSKRPLNHGDYDGWRSIVGQRLSNDGKFLVYGLFPQEGDGEVVIRNLVTGKEQREPAGVRPAPTPPTPGEEGPARDLSLHRARNAHVLDEPDHVRPLEGVARGAERAREVLEHLGLPLEHEHVGTPHRTDVERLVTRVQNENLLHRPKE